MRIPLVLLVLAGSLSSARAAEVVVEDLFGRRLNEHGLVLVDWEGQLANPAIKFFVVPPADATFPARVVLVSQEPRIHFNHPSEIGARGSRKVLEFRNQEKLAAYISIFPDRAGVDQDHVLQLEFQDARGRTQTLRLLCHVVDQDQPAARGWPITIDFSQDRTGFFQNERHRQVVTQAAQDWMYFFEPLPLDPVPASQERTFIWKPDGFRQGQQIVNAQNYTGYLLYAYGIRTSELRSGGEPSRSGGFQSQQGIELPLRRSGGLEIETRGNYNTKGWLVSLADTDFWLATNRGDVANDLYSIAHHEIGHSLVFNPAQPLFENAKRKGRLEHVAVQEYLGAEPRIDRADHLHGSIDTVSRRGAFGYEYHGDMPQCRWLITKLDLLCAQAIGYPLRKTSAFAPLELQTEVLPGGIVGQQYEHLLRATGGNPFYNWDVTAGVLPAGLNLNCFSGVISGTPAQAGVFEFTIRVRDYTEQASGRTRQFRLEIAPR